MVRKKKSAEISASREVLRKTIVTTERPQINMEKGLDNNNDDGLYQHPLLGFPSSRLGTLRYSFVMPVRFSASLPNY